MAKKVHIIGTGGVSKELISFITSEKIKRYEILGCWGPENFDVKEFQHFYKGNDDKLKSTIKADESIIIAAAFPKVKKRVLGAFPRNKFTYETYIHPSAQISDYSIIKEGCILGPQSILTGNVTLEKFTYLSYYSIVGHDSIIGEFSAIFPFVEISGGCIIGSGCVFGLKSACFPKLKVSDGVKLDAGSILRDDAIQRGLYSGNPAKLVKLYS